MAKEFWKKKGNYEVSSRGRVRNAKTKRPIKPFDRNSYKRFDMMSNGKRKTVSVHKLQQELFNGHKGTRKQHVDHNTLVHHIEPNCESHQDYKGIFNENSTGVFNGKIVVEKEAQKTNAFQANNNILVSDKATINTKPQLEIFADDVKCSHGCTIGQLDESAMFYMRSRGIPEKEAKALLMYAFSNNVLNSVKIPEIKQRITKIIANKLGVNIGFDL